MNIVRKEKFPGFLNVPLSITLKRSEGESKIYIYQLENWESFWEPEIGRTYIFYCNRPIVDASDGSHYYNIDGCHDQYLLGDLNYSNHLNGLMLMVEENASELQIVNAVTSSVDEQSIVTNAVSGGFKDHKRSGLWTIGMPFISGYIDGSRFRGKVAFYIFYRDGKILSVDYGPDADLNNPFVLQSFSWYHSQISRE